MRPLPPHLAPLAPLVALLLALASGCGDGAPPVNDVATDTTDLADVSDAAPDDTAPPVAAPVTPLPLAVDGWLVATTLSSTSDPVGDSLEYGSFTTPAAGVDRFGVSWGPVTPDADGVFATFGAPNVYLAASVHVDVPTGVIGRFDNARSVWLDGKRRQPGELYGGAEPVRIPLVLSPGDHTIVVGQARPQRAIRVVLEQTPDAVHFNLDDVTVPDLVAGAEDAQWLGVHVLNLSDGAPRDVVAEVVASDDFEATSVSTPALAPGAVTQLSFHLVPRHPWVETDAGVTVRLHVASPDLAEAYERDVVLQVVPEGARFRRTFLSPVDASTQYYGVLPPSAVAPGHAYGLILSLHGAGDQAIDANAWYGSKDWAYVISPTNRRRFGFDWEEWGHDNALNALADAQAAFPIDPLRLHATGVSMGGHGTWHLAAMHPDRFATFTPSAGWRSFYSYTGDPEPTGAFARARAHSKTIDYLDNLAGASVYIIHGGADPVVPVREARDMFALLTPLTDDVTYHEEPGAGHFWRSADDPDVNCADWPPALDFMATHTRALTPLDFAFRSPAPWYSPTYSYVTVTSAQSPNEDYTLASAASDDGATVTLATHNVRALVADGDALRARGVASLVVDGTAHALPDGPLALGPPGGKRPGVSGPYNQVFRHPFGFIYPDGDAAARDYAAFLVSTWAAIGNGHAFALPESELTDAIAAEYNLVYIGLDATAVPAPPNPQVPFTWGRDGITLAAFAWPNAALMMVRPRGERLTAVLYATPGSAHLLYRLIPFSSRSGTPDYLVWSDDGVEASGFFDASWAWDPALGRVNR